jgi:hypothetical protein
MELLGKTADISCIVADAFAGPHNLLADGAPRHRKKAMPEAGMLSV